MRSSDRLRRRILDRDASVAVIGQGYVGLSLSCAAAEAGFSVIGIDVDRSRTDALDRGVLCVAGITEDMFKSALASRRLAFTSTTASLAGCEVVAICVPTPVRDQAPDLSFVEQACRDVARHLRAGRLVVLESTTYPGTTEERAAPLLEAGGLSTDGDFLLAYSPERIDPGNEEWDFRSIPRVVGGATPEATEMAALFYAQLVDKVVLASSCRAAELAKLLENTFRHVNVALVNEMAMLCHEMGIDIWEVIDAAASKPFGFMTFLPGPGVGGHCIPLDPAYLAWHVRRDAGHQFRVLEQAQDINSQMPAYVSSRIGEALNEQGKAVKGSSILVLGVAYKADVGDARESPAVKVMAQLHRRGARVTFHDPYLERIVLPGGVWARTRLDEEALAGADCAALLTPHRGYDLEWIAHHCALVFDARNAYGDDRRPNVVPL